MINIQLAHFLVGFAFSGYRADIHLVHQAQNSFVIDEMPFSVGYTR